MKKQVFEKVNETVYVETLDNGIEVYLYPTNKTKNFYISISVKYGANVTKYKVDNKEYDIIPGSAHFLEHKVMALSENESVSRRINSLGSLANAWTNYYGTNYNIFGSINLIENLKLLLDIFYNTDINEKCVNEEKGIIGEEIDMYKDQINTLMYDHLYNNIFNNSYVKNTVVGTREDIDKITAKSLNKVYSDYYVPNNTFIIVTGDFDVDEVINVIKNYMNKLNLKKKTIPERIIEKEIDKVNVELEELNIPTEDYRIKYALKIPRKNFKIKNDTFLRYYLGIILSSNFSTTSPLFEKYKRDGLIINMNFATNVVDDYVVIIIGAVCREDEPFITRLKSDLENLEISKVDFERKKKLFLKSYITDFDNIEDIEYNICESILIDGKINYNEYSEIMNMNYEEACDILKSFSYDIFSIIKTIKK
jgi:predicted Zn-dependent peptidase